MKFNKENSIKTFGKTNYIRIDCSVSKASNEIMLHRISEGRDIEFPFSSINKE